MISGLEGSNQIKLLWKFKQICTKTQVETHHQWIKCNENEANNIPKLVRYFSMHEVVVSFLMHVIYKDILLKWTESHGNLVAQGIGSNLPKHGIVYIKLKRQALKPQ